MAISAQSSDEGSIEVEYTAQDDSGNKTHWEEKMEIPHRNIPTIEVYLLAVQWCFKKFKNLNWTSEKGFLNNEEAVQLLNKPYVSCSDYGNLVEDILDMFEA
ncbi:Unknown protein, partial [Striga hermonthica]